MYRVAILGCGRMGRLHAERVLADGRGEVVAIADPLPATAESLRAEVARSAIVARDLADLLAAPDLDAVIICTPTAQHYEQVLACRAQGLHVLCEKPLADTRERIVALIESARSGGGHLSVAYQRRYWAIYRTLRREVLSGRWGRVRSVMSHTYENWQPTIAGTWRDDPVINPGGFVGDAGSHKIDTLFHATGLSPTEVFAYSDPAGSRVEILTSAVAKLQGGVPVIIDFVGHAQHLGEEVHVHCERADLIVRHDRLWIARNERVAPFTDLEPETNPVSAFFNLLDGSAPNEAPPDCALPVFDFTRAMLESSRTGQLVRIGT